MMPTTIRFLRRFVRNPSLSLDGFLLCETFGASLHQAYIDLVSVSKRPFGLSLICIVTDGLLMLRMIS